MSAPSAGDVLSPSRINTFLNCSARWTYRYVYRLPDKPSGSAVRGRAVHSLVSYYFSESMRGQAPDTGQLGDAYAHYWDVESENAEFGIAEDINELRRSGEMLAAKYISEKAPEIQPAAVDVAVSGTIAGVSVRGFIDLIDTSGRIIDLKTAKAKPSGVSADYALQVATYATLAGDRASGEVRLDTIVATKATQIVTIPYTVSEADCNLIDRVYPRAQKAMRSGDYVPNRNSMLCSRKYCSFADACVAEFGGVVD